MVGSNIARYAFFACSALALFGFIHSVTPSGGVYWPWTVGSTLPYQWSAAYAALAVLILILGNTRAAREGVVHAH